MSCPKCGFVEQGKVLGAVPSKPGPGTKYFKRKLDEALEMDRNPWVAKYNQLKQEFEE